MKLSAEGKIQVRDARSQRGWTVESMAPSLAASQLLEPNREGHEDVCAYGASQDTWRRFVRGISINSPAFKAFCQVLGLHWQEVAWTDTHFDWGDAPNISTFCGRTAELATLQEWIAPEPGNGQLDRCQLVTVLGMGGIGKTTLTVKLAQRVQADFRWVVWRSLRSAPPLKELLTDLIQVLSAQRITAATLADIIDAQITTLVTLLQMRCLVVLDNMETILQPEQLGAYRPGYEEYEDLLQRMGTTTHNSCFIITSRECPQNLTTLQGSTVRSLALTGVDQSTGYSILQQSLISVEENLSDQLVQSYQGNPFALILAASTIQTLFNGDVAQFLSQQPQRVFGDLRRLIDQHFQRLSLLEQSVMYWLAIAQEPITLHDLQEDIISIPGQDQDVLEALIRLKGRSLIENITIADTTVAGTTTGFTQQPVVMEYVIDRLIQQVSQEITDWEDISVQQNVSALPLLHTHALLKATAKDYIRDTQTRLILKPIGDRVRSYPLKRLITCCRSSRLLSTGYAVGNFLNLLGYAQSDLTDLDCSGLTVRQADLRNVTLHQVNFTNANLTQSIFAETFSSVLCVAFSPSGEMVATSTSSGKVHQWCVRDGRHYLVFQSSVFQRQGDWCYAIDYSQDGQWLASGGSGRTVELWNLKTGKCWRSLNEHMAGVRTLRFSPDSRLLATAGVDRTIRIWDVNTTDCIQVLMGHEGTVQSVAFAPDGRSLASGAADSMLKIWNISTGNCLNLVGHTADVHTVAYRPDGKTLASAGDDRLIRLWSASTGQSQRILQEHTDAIYSIAYSPDGKTLASAGDDRVIRLWHSSTGALQKSLVGHQSRIWSIAFSPDSRTLVSGSAESKNSADRTIRFWQVETGQLQKTLQGYYRWTSPIAFSSDGSTLLTLCDDRRLRCWLIETGTYRTVTLDIQGSHNATLSPDGRTLVTGSFYDTEIKLFDVYSGQIRKRLTEHTDWVIMAAFNSTGRLMASASSDRTIKLWDTQTGTCLRSFQGHHAPVCCVAFRPNRDVIASGSWDGTVKLWSMTTGECLTTLPQHPDQVGVVMFSPNGQLLFSASQDGLVRFWDVESRKLLQEYNSDDYINRTSFAFSPNSQQFCSIGQSGEIKVHQLNQRECIKVLQGQLGQMYGIVFSPDGRLLATGGEGGGIQFWDMQTYRCVRQLQTPRIYEGMMISEAIGLTTQQRTTLLTLGAFDQSET